MKTQKLSFPSLYVGCKLIGDSMQRHKILKGNIYKKKNGKRGWIVGYFPDVPLPYPFNTKKFSVKWVKLRKGKRKEGARSDSRRKTLCVLVYGQQEISFPGRKTKILKEEGDYVFFEPGVLHSWRAKTDNLTVTFRW
jgi:quercetin dioxygenase-like cupin family protein